VTRLKGMSLLPYDRGLRTADDEVQGVWRSLLTAYQHAQSPPEAAAEIFREADDPFLVEFNDRRPIADEMGADLVGRADPTDYSPSEVRIVDSERVVTTPHMGFSMDPEVGSLGMSVKLESNILSDDQIGSVLTTIRERAMTIVLGSRRR
jgi:hypothetical protein